MIKIIKFANEKEQKIELIKVEVYEVIHFHGYNFFIHDNDSITSKYSCTCERTGCKTGVDWDSLKAIKKDVKERLKKAGIRMVTRLMKEKEKIIEDYEY